MLHISTLSANEIIKPYDNNLLSIDLNFNREEDNENLDERNNSVVFIIDNSSEMTDFINKSKKATSKYQYAVNFVDKFARKMMSKDILSVIKLSDDITPIISMSKKKDISNLYKTYPDGIPNLLFALKNAENILKRVNDKNYNKSIILLTDSDYVSRYNKNTLTEIANNLKNQGIRISVVKINNFGKDNYDILTITTHGSYYDISNKKYFERVIHKELWNSTSAVARSIEVRINFSDNLKISKNINGFLQQDSSQCCHIYIPKSFGRSEILLPFNVLEKKGTIKFEIIVKYKDAISGATQKSKVILKNNIEKNGQKENENIVYRAIYEYRDRSFRKLERILLRNLYGDAIEDISDYIKNLDKFNCFVSANTIIPFLKDEANKEMKEYKRRYRYYLSK